MTKRVILCAGGTGGHVFPAAALAEELLAHDCAVEWITDARGQKFAAAFNGITPHVVQAGLLGKGIHKLLFGTVQSLWLMLKRRPAAVVGFGGYPSVPPVLAAQLLGIPTIVHEQNAVLGKANILLGRFAKRIALSFTPPYRKRGILLKSIVTGNPVRREIAALHGFPYPASDNTFRIFIMGGSLGARVFSDVVPSALAALPVKERQNLDITQQCRAEDMDSVHAVYAQAGIKARLDRFFHDVPDILERSHLVICRSGASTVAELAVAGRPGIFIPYPHHGDAQQKANAQAIVDAGGGWMFEEKDFTPEALTKTLKSIIDDQNIARNAACVIRAFGKPDAAARLASEIRTLFG